MSSALGHPSQMNNLQIRDNAAGARPPNAPAYGMAKDYSYNNTLFATGGCVNLAVEAQKFSFEPDAKCKFFTYVESFGA